LTALHHAVTYESTSCTALLFESGAAVDATTVHGRSPLMCAASKDNVECVKLLLNAGADVHMPSAHAGTALLHSAAYASAQCTQLLLDAGADASAVTSIGTTALHAAALNEQHPQVLQLLLQSISLYISLYRVTHINTTAHCCSVFVQIHKLRIYYS
jgi:ankyrin repeat protein